jgi:hypothetical protein
VVEGRPAHAQQCRDGLGDVLNDEGPLTRAAAGTFLHRLTETMPLIVAIVDLGA